MAWVTAIGPDAAQIEYRLEGHAGCALSAGDDHQVAYRLDGDRPLEWVGAGLREVGIAPGSVLDEAGKTAARALADGLDPRTGGQLVTPKMAVDPRAKLPAGPLVAAVTAAADAAQTTPAELLGDIRIGARYGRMVRGLAREHDAHKVPIKDLERVAAAAGVDLAGLYPAAELALARKYAGARVRVGNRGYDLTLDLPKSYSVLTALAEPALARDLEDAYLDAVRETVAAMEGWAGYGMRGHHGDGQRATRVDGTGLLGWMTVHRTARPVAGAAPDPHLHAHVTLLNLVRGTDRNWSTVGAGGRDLHRHAHAADAYVKARLRALTRQRWGMQWARDPRTGEWEVVGVPKALRDTFSKRAGQVSAQLAGDGYDPQTATTAQAKLAAYRSRGAKRPVGGGDLRADWHRQALAAGVDPATMVAAAVSGQARPAPAYPTLGEVADWMFRPEKGLTAHAKVTTRADLLAAAIDAVPGGIADLAEAERLVDAVLAGDGRAVPLPSAGAVHLSNADRYTTADVVTAERAVLAAARDRYASGTAVIDARTVALAVGAFEAVEGYPLTAEQRAVLDRLTTAGHGVDTVIGVAGSGKTTIMNALRAAYEAAGHTVAGAATAAVAAQNLQAGAGIAARTIESWLRQIGRGEGLGDLAVLVVDEAAMVDDRHLATLLQAAARSGTKVIGIGDPLQLRAVGVGGTFAAVHELLGGLELTENRRQRDVDERAALALWRTGERRQALRRWAAAGRVHVTDTAPAAHTAMLTAWNTERARWSDPHDRIEQLLMLAHTNADVDALNAGARALRQAAGELTGPQRTYRLADGGQLTLGVHDAVLLRVNDRRAHRGGVDVLNGYRGVVTALDNHGRVQIQWRRPGPDGPELVREWVTADYVTRGGVTLGYAITASKAQGLTADRALVYGGGMDAHVLHPAMSRDRCRADLYLAHTLVEDPADATRHGPPATDAEALHRTINAYATALERDHPDRLVLTDLGEPVEPITPTPSTPAPAAEQVLDDAQRLADRIHDVAEQVRSLNTQMAAGAWRYRPHGDVPDRALPAAIAEADRAATRAQADANRHARRAEHATHRAEAGHGPAVHALHDQAAQTRAAAAAADRAAQLRQHIRDTETTARRAWREVAALDAERRRNPIALRLAGTSRATITTRQEELRTQARAADHAAGVGRTELWHAERQAGPPGRAAADLAALETGWDRHLAQARAADQRAARATHTTAATAAEHAQQWRDRAAGLRAETELRGQLDPALAAAQARDRDQVLTARARATQRQYDAAATRRDEAHRHHEPPHRHLDRGPSL